MLLDFGTEQFTVNIINYDMLHRIIDNRTGYVTEVFSSRESFETLQELVLDDARVFNATCNELIKYNNGNIIYGR